MRSARSWTAILFVRGNQEQQLYLLELINQFSTEYEGPLPKVPKARLINVLMAST